MPARGRKSGMPLRGVFRRDRLKEAGGAVAERQADAAEICQPQSEALAADQPCRLVAVVPQPLTPAAARQGVMIAPPLDVVDTKAMGFHHVDRVADVIEFATREDVFPQQPLFGTNPLEPSPRLLGRPRDTVVEEDAPIGQQRMDLPEVSSGREWIGGSCVVRKPLLDFLFARI